MAGAASLEQAFKHCKKAASCPLACNFWRGKRQIRQKSETRRNSANLQRRTVQLTIPGAFD
ncbi:hypothetical protein [Salaquimonas pukyongi]|uniref:hypothetical protein n=1 Tax=Salaquimonas pukyongi TaxID=2712698 RepID=UPI001967D657|nr:hypothetical protein [Salaquimonas pukyongi]